MKTHLNSIREKKTEKNPEETSEKCLIKLVVFTVKI